jgi:uncharacterized membrane protein YfcA
MSPEIILYLTLIGLAAGVLSGLVGVGGGIIIVPALVMVMGISQQSAQGNTLAMLMIPVGALAVLNYYRSGHIDWRIALLLAVGFIPGAWVGSKLALAIPALTLKRIFGVLLLLVAAKFLFNK